MLMKYAVVLLASWCGAMTPPAEEFSSEPGFGGAAGGLGTVLFGPIDIENRVPGRSSSVLGVVDAWGHYWFTSRNNDAPGGGPVLGMPHKIFKFTKTGEYVATFLQPTIYDFIATTTSSAWGGRDIAVDEAANRFYYGWEQGHFAWHEYDPVTGSLGPGTAVRVPGYSNSIRSLTILEGTGRFLAGDANNPLREFTVNQGILASHPNTFLSGGQPATVAGLAYTNVDGPHVWIWAQNGPATYRHVTAIELDVSSTPFRRTGREFLGVMIGSGSVNIAGGAKIECRDGRLALTAMHQAFPDTLVVYSLDGSCGGGCPCACNFDMSTGPGVCDIFDFLAFGNAFTLQDPCACDMDVLTGPGLCDIFDFLAFGNGFNQGCP